MIIKVDTDKQHLTVYEKAKKIERLEAHGISRKRINACMKHDGLSFDAALLFLETQLIKEANKEALRN